MTNYTTPSITLEVEEIDLTSSDVYVTIVQGDIEMTKTGSDLTVTYENDISTIVFTLTQTESALFQYSRSAKLQVNYINAAGVRDATNIAQIDVLRNLLDEEISYGS